MNKDNFPEGGKIELKEESEEAIIKRVDNRIVSILELGGYNKESVEEKVKAALKELGVPYEYVWVNPDADRSDDRHYLYKVIVGGIPEIWPKDIGRNGKWSLSFSVPERYEPAEHP